MTFLRSILPAFVIAAAANAQAPIVGGVTPGDTLPLQHVVRGSSVIVNQGGIASVAIDPAFRYVGGHRFILLGVADAEQHTFADADAAGNIRRFYWLQFEHYLPTAANSSYNYGQDSLLTRDGLEWRVQVRQYTSAPAANSDRAALYALFAKAGLRPPLPASRVRLVNLTSPDNRSELMIVYAEASASDSAPSAAQLSALVSRAQSGLQVTRR